MSETFSFEEFISGANVAELSVDIFQDGSLLGLFDEWKRRFERADRETPVERSAGEVSPLAALEAEGAKLLAELEASKTVWFVRGLTTEDEIAIDAAHPIPESPVKAFTEAPPTHIRNGTEKQAEAFIAAYTSWITRRDEFNSAQQERPEAKAWMVEAQEAVFARGAEKISRAFRRIERDGETVTTTPPSIEQIRRLPTAIGEMQVAKLVNAVEEASSVMPEVPADFLHLTSKTTQD